MPKIQNSFLRGRMNKDFDERLVPKGEYLEAQNILITQSEDSDVGAIENILGNALAKNELSLSRDTETIGYYVDVSSKRVFWFVTDFNGSLSSTVRNMARPSSGENIRILMANIDQPDNIKTLVKGAFLNFSKRHLITGVNLIDDLLFFTDDYNQPRKINITRAEKDENYYTKEEQISVAKVSPYLAPILHNNAGEGDSVTLTKDAGVTSDYLKDKFVRFSYRYKYEDGEYTTMAPFTQIVFKPLSNATIEGVLTTDRNKSDEQDIYSKTIVDIMKNDYNKIDLRIPLPGDEQALSTSGWQNDLRISKIEILIKESDEDVVKVIKEIDVSNDAGNTLSSFSNNVESYAVRPSGENYYRYAYKFIYRSEEPYKILEDKQITRVFDQVPLRAKAQEISGNRVIYANFTENYDLPKDEGGKTGINYVINNINKGNTEFDNINDGVGLNDYSVNTYKYHSLKQRRTYQVGVVLADKFGRQSPVILSTNEGGEDGMADTITIPNVSEDLSTNYESAYSWSNQQEAIGKSLSINFKDNRIVDASDIYNGDINSRDYNPYGWYSYKIVVKQQEQEYYNIYTNHPADNWNNESNAHDDVLGYSWVSLYGDNINKVTRDVSEVDEVREGVAGSDTRLFPKVIKKETTTGEYTNIDNSSTFGADIDSIEVMTIGTAREQGILTREDRDKDRVHDFVMSKRNPLLAQLKGLQTNNRVKFTIDVEVIENNDDDKTYFKIGDGNTINPYIRVGQEVTLKVGSEYGVDEAGEPVIIDKSNSNVGKKIISVNIENDEQENSELSSKTIMTDGREIKTNRGDSAMMRVGQFIDFEEGESDDVGLQILLHESVSSGDTSLKVKGRDAHDIFTFLRPGSTAQSFNTSSALFNRFSAGKSVSLSTFNEDTAGFEVGEETLITQGFVSTIAGATINSDPANNIYTFTFNRALVADMPANTLIVFLKSGFSNQNVEQFRNEVNTTATIVEQGGPDDFHVRRPILQKVQLNENSKNTIMHFDRTVFPPNILHIIGSSVVQKMALFDPLTIKSVETVTEGNKVFQKIKLSHGLALNSGNKLVIQNLEEEPIAVNTGLSVFETDPVKSRLDIFYETSTSGLISDLNELTTTSVSTGYPINLQFALEDTFTETHAIGSVIGGLSAETTTSNGSIEFELENVIRKPNEDVTSSFEIVNNSIKLLSGFHFKPETSVINVNGIDYNFIDANVDANNFIVNYKAKDTVSNEYSSATANLTLANSEPIISFDDETYPPDNNTVAPNLSPGTVLAKGSFFNGSINNDLNFKDVFIEVFSPSNNAEQNLVGPNGADLFEVVYENTPNEFEVKYLGVENEVGTVSLGGVLNFGWVFDNIAGTQGDSSRKVLQLGVRIIDAGGNVKEIIKDLEPQVSSSGAYDTRRSFRVMELFDETTDAAICARDFDANALIHLALGFNETQDPSYIHEVEINNNFIDNTFSSDVFAFAPVTGASIHEGNKVFFSTNGNDFAANKTFKFFHKYELDIRGEIKARFKHFDTDENGIVGVVRDCEFIIQSE
jgi:hypothetical protein